MDDLRARIVEIRKIRKEQEELRNVITSTLTHDLISKQSALQQIHEAYSYFNDEASSAGTTAADGALVVSRSNGGVNVLSVTPDGSEAFRQAVTAYLAKIDGVEAELESKIREFLDRAKDDSNEMFRVCAKFHPLFVRPRIQSAIREYQEQLIHTVKKDIDALQAKFSNKFAASEARKMSELLRDLPPVSSMIIWAKQIERQLNMYMSRVESVLGKQWYHHFDGRQLKRDTDDFRAKLKPIRLYQHWLVKQQEQVNELQVRGPIFKVISSKTAVRLEVNFDRKLITLFKEVRNLARLDCKVRTAWRHSAVTQRFDSPEDRSMLLLLFSSFFLCFYALFARFHSTSSLLRTRRSRTILSPCVSRRWFASTRAHAPSWMHRSTWRCWLQATSAACRTL